jgi:hypothetical protein
VPANTPAACSPLLSALKAALLSSDPPARAAAACAAAALASCAPASAAAAAVDADVAEHLFEALRLRSVSAAADDAAAAAEEAAARDATAALRCLAAGAGAGFRRRFVFGAASVAARFRSSLAAGDPAAACALARLAEQALEADPLTLPRPMALALAHALADALAALSPEASDDSDNVASADVGQPLSPPAAAVAHAACDALAALARWLPFGRDASGAIGRGAAHAAAALRHAPHDALHGIGEDMRLDDAGGGLFTAACELLRAWAGCCARGGAGADAAAAAAAAERALAAADAHIAPIGLAAIEAHALEAASATSFFALLAALLAPDAATPPRAAAAAAAKLAAHGALPAAFAATTAVPAARPAAAAFLAAVLFAHPSEAVRSLLAEVAPSPAAAAALLALLPPRLDEAVALLRERPRGGSDAEQELARAQRGLLALLRASLPDEDGDDAAEGDAPAPRALCGGIAAALREWCEVNGAALAGAPAWTHALLSLLAHHAPREQRADAGDDAGEAALVAAAAACEPALPPASAAARWLLARAGAHAAPRMLAAWLRAHGAAWPDGAAAHALPPLLRLLLSDVAAAAALLALVAALPNLAGEEAELTLRALEVRCASRRLLRVLAVR